MRYTLRLRSAGVSLALLLAGGISAQAAEDPPKWPHKSWVHSAANAEPRPLPNGDVSISYECGFFGHCDLADYARRSKFCALYVIKGGEPVLYRTGPGKCEVDENRIGVASISKSITSVLFGLAFQANPNRRPLNLDVPVAPTLAKAGVTYTDPTITFRDLLHMSSGMIWREESRKEKDYIRVAAVDGKVTSKFATLKQAANARLATAKFKQTKPYHYSAFDSQILGILTEYAGAATLAAQLEQKVWRHGMREVAKWNSDDEHHAAAYCCFYTSPADLAAFGDWILQKYRSGTDRFSDWVRQSVGDTVDSGDPCTFKGHRFDFRYGYQWWVPSSDPRDGFTGLGRDGQYLHLFPIQNVVIVEFGASKPRTCEAMVAHRLIADALATHP